MKAKRIIAAGALVTAGALAFSGCSAPQRNTEIVANSKITVAWNDPYFAYNNNLANTNATANAVVNYLVKGGSQYYDPTPALQKNEKFMKIEKVSDDPLKVKYTVGDGVKWTDGQAVDAADLLFYWAAYTTHRGDDLSLGKDATDSEGAVKADAVGDKVIWNTGATEGRALDLVKEVPEISNDNKTVTLTYDKPYVDWQTAFDVDMPAAATVELAYPDKYTGDDGGKKAKADLIKAIQNDDRKFLAPVAKSFREDFTFNEGMPTKPQQTVSNGAYKIKNIQKDEYVTLEANPDYAWGDKPKYSEVTIRAVNDPQAQIDALQNGDIQIASAQPNVDLLQKLAQSKSVKYQSSQEGTYEHIDLQTGAGGVFDPSKSSAESSKLLRQAFLQTVPRQEIIDKLIKPLNPDAAIRQSNVFLPGSDNYDDAVKQTSFKDYTGDIAKAQELIKQSGISKPTVRILYANNNPRRASEFQLIKASAEKAGFTIVDAGNPKWSPALSGAKDSYDVAFFGWNSTSLNVGESGANYIQGGTNNHFGWADPEINKIFKELDVTADKGKQKELLINAEKIISSNAWTLPIFQFPGVVAWHESVDGVKAGFLSPSYFWNFWDWKPASGTSQTTK